MNCFHIPHIFVVVVGFVVDVTVVVVVEITPGVNNVVVVAVVVIIGLDVVNGWIVGRGLLRGSPVNSKNSCVYITGNFENCLKINDIVLKSIIMRCI